MPYKETAVYHSIQWFNNQTQITNRTLDRSVCVVAREQSIPKKTLDTPERVKQIADMNLRLTEASLSTGCLHNLYAEGVMNSVSECGQGFQKN